MRKIWQIFLTAALCLQTIAAEASEKGVNIYGAARDVPSKAVYGEAGNRVRMDDFKGDFVLAVFWSRYCVPCIRELESLNEFARQTKNDGIRVILISPKEEWQGGFAEQRRLLSKYGAPDLETYVDDKSDLAAAFGIFSSPVTVLIAPFTVPEEGLRVEFTDVDGATNSVPLLANQAGTSYAAGEVISQTLSSSSDGIIPCTSPVEWPIGYRDGVGVFNTTTQPLWMTDHIWTASQPQATMTYEVSEDNPAPVKIEVNNFVQYNYSSGCVKGSWTGDYFEFDVPVRNFKAGTEVTLTLPTYGRGAPLFWDVYYLDGEEWKCDRSSHTSPDGQFTMMSTLMIEHGNRDGSFEGIKYEVKMRFENAIQSGHLKIRFQVAHGGYITNPAGAYSTACRELTAEERKTFDIGATLFAFVNKSGNVNSVKIEW